MAHLIDKDALVAEIERLVNNYDKALDYEAALEDVRDFLDSLEAKEPQVKESAILQHKEETCKENGDSLTQEPVSEVWHDAQTEQPQAKEKILATNEYGDCEVDFAINMALYWPKVIKWAYIEDLLNLSNVQRTGKNWNEPVSEEFNAMCLDENGNPTLAKETDFTRGFVKGAQWQKRKDSASVSEELEEAAEEWDAKASFTPFYMTLDDKGNPNGVRQDYTTHAESFKAGAQWDKEQMMAKAIDGYVIEDIEEGNGDFLLSAEYIPKSMDLKDRQKVKVIVIRED